MTKNKRSKIVKSFPAKLLNRREKCVVYDALFTYKTFLDKSDYPLPWRDERLEICKELLVSLLRSLEVEKPPQYDE